MGTACSHHPVTPGRRQWPGVPHCFRHCRDIQGLVGRVGSIPLQLRQFSLFLVNWPNVTKFPNLTKAVAGKGGNLVSGILTFLEVRILDLPLSIGPQFPNIPNVRNGLGQYFSNTGPLIDTDP